MTPYKLLIGAMLAVAPVTTSVSVHGQESPPAVAGAATEPSAVAPEESPPSVQPEGGAEVGPRDPFRPFLNQRKKMGLNLPRVGLQAYDVRQLKLVAVLWDMNPPRALIQDAAGMGFVVGPGTPIGRKEGVVAVIEPGRVIVEEKTPDFHNNIQITREIMEIPREDEPQRVGRERQ